MVPSISMNSSPSASEPAAVPTTNSDFTKAAVQMGQLYSQGLSAAGARAGGAEPGDNANVQAVPVGFPTSGKSRAPTQGSGMPDRSKNLAKLRRK